MFAVQILVILRNYTNQIFVKIAILNLVTITNQANDGGLNILIAMRFMKILVEISIFRIIKQTQHMLNPVYTKGKKLKAYICENLASDHFKFALWVCETFFDL